MKKILIGIYVLSALVFCYAVTTESDLIRTITKPIPLLVLIIATKPAEKYSKFILFGFIFSLFGDIFLMKVIDLFILGLASFLVAHIFYILAFVGRLNSFKILSSIPFYLVGIGLSYWFYPYLGDMLIPVFLYIFVIMTMVWRSYLQRKFNKFAIYAFIGAILFAVSDTNIAITKFIQDYEYSKIVTIVLYWSAQYLIGISIKKA